MSVGRSTCGEIVYLFVVQNAIYSFLSESSRQLVGELFTLSGTHFRRELGDSNQAHGHREVVPFKQSRVFKHAGLLRMEGATQSNLTPAHSQRCGHGSAFQVIRMALVPPRC